MATPKKESLPNDRSGQPLHSPPIDRLAERRLKYSQEDLKDTSFFPLLSIDIKSKYDDIGERKDRLLQRELWTRGFGLTCVLLGHQFEAVRHIAGLKPKWPLDGADLKPAKNLKPRGKILADGMV
jgi:hypothetical protein